MQVERTAIVATAAPAPDRWRETLERNPGASSLLATGLAGESYRPRMIFFAGHTNARAWPCAGGGSPSRGGRDSAEGRPVPARFAGEINRCLLRFRAISAMRFLLQQNLKPYSVAMKTEDIAKRLVALCREQKWETAQKELYAADAVSTEPYETPGFAKETKGLPGILEKGKKFQASVETMHSLAVSEPMVANNAFACTMRMDVTMRGQGRMNMGELCVYEVKDGKIVSERFYV